MNDPLIICPYCQMPLVEHLTSTLLGFEWSLCDKAPTGSFTQVSDDGEPTTFELSA